MNRLLLVALLAVSGSASAQPGQDPPPYPPPPPAPDPYAQPQPQPPPQPYPQPYAQPYGQPVAVQLSADDHELLQRGEITEGQHVGGAAVSIFLGFGIGQAVQGRYSDTGWIFTLGELASFTALVVGLTQVLDECRFQENCNDGEALFVGGLVGLIVFRVWEVVDAVGGPQKHNRRVRELRMRLGMPMPMYTHRLAPFVNRTRDGGATAGVTFRF